MALQDPLVSHGHPAVAGPVVEVEVEVEAVPKGLSRPAAALELQTQMVASIAQTKMMRASAIPIASDPSLEFRARPDLSVSAALPERTRARAWAPEHLLGAPPHRDWRRSHAKC